MISKVGVVGVGQMGSGIAEVCARAGYDTKIAEVSPAALQGAVDRINRSVVRGVERGRVSDEEYSSFQRSLHPVASLDDMADRDLVISATVEDFEVKRRVFQGLDKACPPETIFASNTSSFSIIELGVNTSRPERFLGLHFFNPVPVMDLVEVVQSITVDPAVLEEVRSFAHSLGKHTILVRDNPGFVVNRLLIPFLLDAIRAYESGLATKEDIDSGSTLGCNHPMGPLTLADYIGLDVVYNISLSLYREFRETRYAPPIILKQLYLAGMLGRKTGRGFYDYGKEVRK